MEREFCVFPGWRKDRKKATGWKLHVTSFRSKFKGNENEKKV